MMQTVTGTAPSFWAPYLINGDDSGMETREILQADAFRTWLGGNVVSCEGEHFFAWNHDGSIASLQVGLGDIGGADCLEYTGIVK